MLIRKLGHHIVTKHTLFSTAFLLWEVTPKIRDLHEAQIAFEVMFQLSERSIRHPQHSFHTYLHTCVNRDNTIFKCTTMLFTWGAVACASFKTSAGAKLLTPPPGEATARGSTEDNATSQTVNGRKLTITTLCGIYSQYTVTHFVFIHSMTLNGPQCASVLRSLFPYRTRVEQRLITAATTKHVSGNQHLMGAPFFSSFTFFFFCAATA